MRHTLRRFRFGAWLVVLVVLAACGGTAERADSAAGTTGRAGTAGTSSGTSGAIAGAGARAGAGGAAGLATGGQSAAGGAYAGRGGREAASGGASGRSGGDAGRAEGGDRANGGASAGGNGGAIAAGDGGAAGAEGNTTPAEVTHALDACGLNVAATLDVQVLSLPTSLSGADWGAKVDVCTAGGFELARCAGHRISMYSFRADEERTPGLPTSIWVLMDADGSTCCIYESDETLPGLYAIDCGP